jgi:hypothetical protein
MENKEGTKFYGRENKKKQGCGFPRYNSGGGGE